VRDLRRMIGKEKLLDQFHLSLRQVAGKIPKISAHGFCLVSCSDEREGAIRSGFDRDVATPLMSGASGSTNHVFSISNLGSRLEPGAFSLVDEHFMRKAARGSKLLIVEIASHVGRIRHGQTYSYGQVERFGRQSLCCGALTALLEAPDTAGTVPHPWFEHLNAFFGPVRLAALREINDSTRMIAVAIVHAALQAESAVSEVFQHPPETLTDILLIGGVSVNQQWADGFLPVAFHHLRADAGVAEIVSGYSLRTTPEALKIDVSGARIEVEGELAMEAKPQVQRRLSDAEAEAEPVAEEALAALSDLAPHHKEELEKRLEQVRDQVESVRHDPAAWRSYARPILRGLFRGLSVVQPELGVAAMLYEGGEKLFASHKLKQIIDHGPSTNAGRRMLQEIETELHQLNHEDAQQVLDSLLSKKA